MSQQGNQTKTVFQGESMTCCMCNKTQQSDPSIESQWTYIKINEHGFYVCPNCLQDNPQAKRGNYETVYQKVLRRIMRLIERSNGNVLH